MTRHTSYRGVPIDMEALRNEHSHSPAIGNMSVNAKGDLLGPGGTIAKTVDQIARENQRVRTPIQQTSLKGDLPDAVNELPAVSTKAKPVPRKSEKELDNRDIMQDGEE